MVLPYLQYDLAPILLAHRGGNIATENTVEAFSSTQAIGCKYMETDARVTKDNVVVVFHDSTLNRLAGRPDYISDLTWNELKDIELRGGGTIPRLDDVLKRFPDLRFNIEPKSDRTVQPLADVIQATGSIHRVCVGSFSSSRVRAMQRLLGPELCTSPGISIIPWIILRAVLFPQRPSRYACLQTPNIFRPAGLGRWLVRRVQSAGLQVHIWTPNTEATIIQALNLNVDGIITDEVSLGQQVLATRV